MYAAKNQGKGRTQVYVSGMHSMVRDRQALTADLRNAVARGEMMVLYQPCVRLAACVPSGAEALVRWNHPTRGVIGPDDFVPLAEESGAIQEIGQFVLYDACRILAEWQAGPETQALEINVNVSAKQVHDPSFVALVRNAIRETGILPGGLTLEITETAMIRDPDRCLETLTQLKRLGVRLALDDFGTGYSSLSYLKRFPIDVLKIDKSFIRDLYRSERETLLTTATIAFGKSLNLEIYAEGIETEDQLSYLRALDCEFGQGYLISRPLRKPDLHSFLQTRLQEAA
jgi:EAL domain-containing protein (putative c-di-GMP-specific phosphodiesterase class I)